MARLKQKWRSLSIRQTTIAYTVAFMLLATAMSGITMNRLEHWESQIYLKYYSYEDSLFTDARGRKIVIGLRENTSDVEFARADQLWLTVIGIAKNASIPVFYGGCIIIAAYLFYRNKLKRPIGLIERSALKIAQHELDFELRYDAQDEMGRLIGSLESMRSSLSSHYGDMWRMMEERKRLNAVFSHDLRTPLTVLRGYTDFLNKYVPQRKVSEEKLQETLSAISNHAKRIESYVDSMNAIQKLEDIAVNRASERSEQLAEQLASVTYALEKVSRIRIDIVNRMEHEELLVDSSIVLRVADNLLSNALRYARSRVWIELSNTHGSLMMQVSDDGAGFTPEELKRATAAFYRSNSADNDNKDGAASVHFGLGLYICRLLCEKHGGSLLLANRSLYSSRVSASADTPAAAAIAGNGAVVTAIFSLESGGRG